jgi:N-acetylmuramoyl-L-alanine amidase
VNGSKFVDRYQASPNHEPRARGMMPHLVVLHYTGMVSGQVAADWLCNPESRVSCHYLIDLDGSVVQMVDEERRAWHAGVASWRGEIDINSASIGIEIQNIGHSGGCPPFPPVQMRRVGDLCLDIMRRYDLRPRDVIAHSDIAPGRKIDPGEAFEWRYLAERGIGHLVVVPQHARSSVPVTEAQAMLRSLGYGIDQTGQNDDRTRIVLEAVQRRYRPWQVDGKLDAGTSEIIRRLMAIDILR